MQLRLDRTVAKKMRNNYVNGLKVVHVKERKHTVRNILLHDLKCDQNINLKKTSMELYLVTLY